MKITEEFPKTLEDSLTIREDKQEELIFTIDGPTTQALDDAISITKLSENNYRLGIHIADVASLIKPGSALDGEAKKRAASTYVLNTFHMPMLPRELNSGICSLHQD